MSKTIYDIKLKYNSPSLKERKRKIRIKYCYQVMLVCSVIVFNSALTNANGMCSK